MGKNKGLAIHQKQPCKKEQSVGTQSAHSCIFNQCIPMQCPLRSGQATACQLPGLEFKDSECLKGRPSHRSHGQSKNTATLGQGEKSNSQSKQHPCRFLLGKTAAASLHPSHHQPRYSVSQRLLFALKHQDSLFATHEPHHDSKSTLAPWGPRWPVITMGVITIFKTRLFISS